MGKTKIKFPKRGDIFYVNFEPAIGSEIKKVRPALILQNNIGNRFASTTIIAAISSQTKRQAQFAVFLKSGQGNLPKNSLVLLNQIRTVDKVRLQKRLGHLDQEMMSKVNKALKISLALEE